MYMLGIKDGKTEKTEQDTDMKTCSKCFHECHCEQPLHADEYGLCTCEECKC